MTQICIQSDASTCMQVHHNTIILAYSKRLAHDKHTSVHTHVHAYKTIYKHTLKLAKRDHNDYEVNKMTPQDQILMNNAFKSLSNGKCIFCHTDVDVSHLISSCKVLLGNDYYTMRHSGMCKYFHWTRCKKLNIECSSKSSEHKPENTVGNKLCTIHDDYTILTATYIEKGPFITDTVIWNNEKVATFVEVRVLNYPGLNRAEREKITKCQCLM